jgi:nucleoside-diphosphate-sugar epimerase
LEFHLADLTDEKSLDKFRKIDYLIHCASMTNAEKSFGKEKEMYKNNLDCLKTVINFCKKNKVKLIHLSSTSVYGKQAALVDEHVKKIPETTITLCKNKIN